jgi:hypothetical protein
MEERAVLAVPLPAEYFPDGDDICRAAGTHLARELGAYLERAGHTIPDWARGGCLEDAWVHLESERRGGRYEFAIVYFPRGRGDWMAIQGSADPGGADRAAGLRELLRGFGAAYPGSEVLTQPEFEAQY